MNNDHINKRIREALKDSDWNFSKVARQLGLSIEYLKKNFAENNVVEIAHWPLENEPADISTLGRSGHRQFVIAVKRRMAFEGYPKKYREIILDARKKFDNGTHDMYTAPTRGWAVLYLVPRRTPVEPCNFFGSVTDDS